MLVGIIYVGWETEEYIEMSLKPWMDAKKTRLGGHDYLICAVSVPFAGFEQPPVKDRTLDKITFVGPPDHHIISDQPMTEIAARSQALHWLVDQGCDIVWMVDSDEAYQVTDIQRLVAFVESEPLVAWFRVSLKNLFRDERHYLAEPFIPPRIYRTKIGSYELHSFSADNDISYGGTITRDILPHTRFSSMTIPKEVAWPRHYSWMNAERSRRKIRYQVEGRGWPSCSFAWSEDNGLTFNAAHFMARGEPLPEVVSE